MASASDEDIMDNTSNADDDLFGSEDGGEKVRELSDRELDSGDDENRYDRAPQEAEGEEVDYVSGVDQAVYHQIIYRHALPNPADGEVRYNARNYWHF
jgi:RNA polymerase-associated protein LEO1